MQSRGEERESHTVGDRYSNPSPQEVEAGARVQVQPGLCGKSLALKQTTTKKDGWVCIRDESKQREQGRAVQGARKRKTPVLYGGISVPSPCSLTIPQQRNGLCLKTSIALLYGDMHLTPAYGTTFSHYCRVETV